MPEEDYILVLNTCNSDEIASLISDMLVSQKLAACVNIIKSMESVYQWQGEIQRDQEFLLIIKTRQSLYPSVEKMIQELHNYELPEIIAVPVIAGEKKYLDWIQSATNATEKS